MVDLGYDIIFTSLQIPEENDQTKLTYLGELCQLLKDKSVTYIIDINPSLLNQNVYRFSINFLMVTLLLELMIILIMI